MKYLEKVEKVIVEVVFTVAIIAIARKIIIQDVKELFSPTLMGIGVIVFALSAGYYLLTRKREV